MILFDVGQDSAKQVKPKTIVNGKKVLERDIQKIFEGSLHEILGVHFLASEYSTSFGGRMDTLGIDDDGNPCIIEYKKGQNENVINQGLSYLRWLLDHKDSFHVLCQEKGVVGCASGYLRSGGLQQVRYRYRGPASYQDRTDALPVVRKQHAHS